MGRLRDERIQREGSPVFQYIVPRLTKDIPYTIDFEAAFRGFEKYYPFNYTEVVNLTEAIISYSPRPGIWYDVYPFQTKIIIEQTVTIAAVKTPTVITPVMNWNVVINFQRLPTSVDRQIRGVK